MCQINNVLHNTGSKSITCYKVLRKDSGSIRSPYFINCLWKLGETKSLKQRFFCDSCIRSGFFHALTNKNDAYFVQAILIEMDLFLASKFSDDYIITEMEIPPYTDYYTGITENGIDSIATPVITFKQIL